MYSSGSSSGELEDVFGFGFVDLGLTSLRRGSDPDSVIPGRCQRVRARRGPMTGSASNPESRDSGSGPADHPGMTVSGLRTLSSARVRTTRWLANDGSTTELSLAV